MLTAIFFGCASKDTSGDMATSGRSHQEEKLTFGVTVCMITGYYTAMVNAIEAKADEMGIEIVLLIAENDTTKQNQQMENLIAQQVDAIICNPEDGTAIAASVQKAMDADIPVVMVDRDVDGAEPAKRIINDSYTLAKQLVQWFCRLRPRERLKRSAEYAHYGGQHGGLLCGELPERAS